MTVRAKFLCLNVCPLPNGGSDVVMTAANWGGPADNPENKRFWEATPNGHLNLTINNPAAAGIFESGRYYYLDFTPATGNQDGPASVPEVPSDFAVTDSAYIDDSVYAELPADG